MHVVPLRPLRQKSEISINKITYRDKKIIFR